MGLVRVVIKFAEEAIKKFGVNFIGEGRLLGPLWEALLELRADFFEELGEDVVGGQLIEGLLGIVGAI